MNNYEKLPSFERAIAVFKEEEEEEKVRELFKNLYEVARDKVLRNCDRYFSGVYLLCGFGDPDFAETLWNVISTYTGRKDAPKKLSRFETIVYKFMEDGVAELHMYHHQRFQKLLGKGYLDAQLALVNVLKSKGREAFVEMVLKKENLMAQELCKWLGAMSHTQPLEKTFLDYDNQVSRGGSNRKDSATTAHGRGATVVTHTSKVSVARVMTDAIADDVSDSIRTEEREEQGNAVARPVKPKQSQSIKAKAERFEEGMKSMIPTDAQVKDARKVVTKAQEFFTTPRYGLSERLKQHFQAVDAAMASGEIKDVAKSLESLLVEGKDLDLDICVVQMCYGDQRCGKDVKKYGRKPNMIPCTKCGKEFHPSCVAKVLQCS